MVRRVAATQTRHIRISVDTKGNRDLKDLADRLGGVTKSTKSLAQSVNFLKNSFLGFLGGFGISQLVAFSDEMQNLNNRIISLSKSQADADAAMQLLLKTANETNTSVDGLGDSYARLAVALKDTGISQKILFDVTKTLTNTFRLSGSTIGETTATIVQLSQAFASGQLRGQELRSVMEQNAVLAGLLRKEFGKDIYKKAADGAIDAADVFRILFKNMEQINARAEVLTPTIGQSLTKALNNLKFSINEVNKDFGISSGFAKGLDLLTQKLSLIGVVIGILALTQIPKLILQLERLSIFVYTFAATNPMGAALAAIGIAIVLLVDDLDGLKKVLYDITAAFVRFGAGLQEADAAIYRFQSHIPGLSKSAAIADQFQANADNLRNFANFLEENSGKVQYPGISAAEKTAAQEREDYLKRLEEIFGKLGKKTVKIKEVLAGVNQEFIAGKISAEQYSAKLVDFEFYKLNREFKEGKINLNALNKGLNELQRNRLNREFSQGVITLQQFNYAIEQNRIADLNTDLAHGTISLKEYNAELVKISETFNAGGALRAGTQSYLDSIGTTSQQVANAIQNAFTGLETYLSEFIKTGKFNFAQFTQAILDDLTKIIIRASIIRPLAEGILSFGTSAAAGGATSTNAGNGQYAAPPTFAKGGIFDSGLKKYAGGGVVSSPTMFGYGQNKSGVMGEAGPEAILPLSRSNGKLGVEASVTPVTINIINNTSSEVKTSESVGPAGDRTIEVLIVNKVREGIATGSFDRAMSSSYGLNRKGS